MSDQGSFVPTGPDAPGHGNFAEVPTPPFFSPPSSPGRTGGQPDPGGFGDVTPPTGFPAVGPAQPTWLSGGGTEQSAGGGEAGGRHHWSAVAAEHTDDGPVRPGQMFAAAGGSELLGEQVRATQFVEPKKIPPTRSWRRLVYVGSFHKINPGESPDEQKVRQMRELIAMPLMGTFSVAVLGGKGGVGKTTTTVALGSAFARLRPREQVIALDADPGQGANLATRIDPSAASSYGDIMAAGEIVRYSDMRARVGHNAAGLDVIAAATHRAAGAGGQVSADLYRTTRERLERFYNVILTDCGVDIESPVMAGVLGRADALVMVMSAVPDGAEGAAKQLDWLHSQPQYRPLLERAVLIINHIRPTPRRADRKATGRLVETLTERFSTLVPRERIIEIPFDRHVAAAGLIDSTELRPQTSRRFLEATAALAEAFPTAAGPA